MRSHRTRSSPGSADVEWPARLEWLRTAEGHFVLVDAAHNPAGAAALADYLRAAGVAPLPLVFAVMQDKAVDAILSQLVPTVSAIVATQAGSPRAMSAADLAAHITATWPSLPVVTIAEPDRALARALDRGGRAVVAGSIFLVGPLRARLIARGATTVDEPA